MSLPARSSSNRPALSAGPILTPAFVVAVVLLALAAGLVQVGEKWLNIKQGKQPLPLKTPLGALDEKAIAPYRVVRREVLDPVVVEALGTDQYLSWRLEDTSAGANDPLRFANLLVTYDTGGHNLVPHTPDVCRLGGGYEAVQPHENRNIDVPSLAPDATRVPIRVCTFAKTALYDRSRETVVYTFHCNGRFVATRTEVRLLINSLSTTYAYFSKVEVSFPQATRARSIDGVRKLFGRLLPVLVQRHWPDFRAKEEEALDISHGRSPD